MVDHALVVNINENSQHTGVVWAPDNDGQAAVVRDYVRLPNGKFGPVQKHGGIVIGDVLYSINNTLVSMVKHHEVITILQSKAQFMTLTFLHHDEHYRRKRGLKTKIPVNNLSIKPDPDFLSIIRKSRITFESNKKFAEYEIVCQYRMKSTERLHDDKILKWVLWKRFSMFFNFYKSLVNEMGWRSTGLTFPSHHIYTIDKYSINFLEQRREELNVYWGQVLALEHATDFNMKHRRCNALADFLSIDAILSDHPPPSCAVTTTSCSYVDSKTAILTTINMTAPNTSEGNTRPPSASSTTGATSTQPCLTALAAVGRTQPNNTATVIPSLTSANHLNTTTNTISPPTVPPRLTTVATGPAIGSLPPKAQDARSNLLADIAKRRIE